MKKKRRLLWHLYPSYLLITLISLFAVSWFASSSLQSFFIKHITADLTSRAYLLEKQFEIFFNKPDISPDIKNDINNFCKETDKRSSTRITLIAPSGKVLGDSIEEPENMVNHHDRPEIIMALKNNVGTSIRYSETLRQNMIYVAIALKKENKTVAVIRTSIPLTSIDSKLKSIQLKIAGMGLLIALIAAGVSLIVSRRITKPIEEMRQGAENFAKGNLEHKMVSPDLEEMGSLADAMNHMAAQLDDRIKTVIRQKSEIEAVFSSMIEGVIAIDNSRHVININQAAQEMINCASEVPESADINSVINNHELMSLIQKAVSRAESVEEDIVFYQKRKRILHAFCTPVYNTREDIIGSLILLNDVTKYRHLENIRRDFAANVSHELKTPLTAIKGFVETLQHGEVNNPDDVERFLNIIGKHVDRLSCIIDDLMNLSKIEQMDERKEIKLIETRLNDVIENAVSLCREKANVKKIKIDQKSNEEISARIDAYLFEQAIINLLDNAIKYSKNNSNIYINATNSDAGITIDVKDFGAGIHKEHLPRLFERFYRADKARSRKMGGTGLGLAIVKHIIKAHGGCVSVNSIPGQGSTFTIHLPNQNTTKPAPKLSFD